MNGLRTGVLMFIAVQAFHPAIPHLFRPLKKHLVKHYRFRTTATRATMSTTSTTSPDQPKACPPGYKVITEGKASMIYPADANEVFYNPVQVVNRDLSVSMIRLFAERRVREKTEKQMRKNRLDLNPEEIDKILESTDWAEKVRTQDVEQDGIRILDALAATGLRSIRYVKEIPGIKEVIVNDLDPAAVEQAKKNVEYNEADPLRVKPQQGNATMVMYKAMAKKEFFDVIDIDPYGSAAPFLDAAVQAVADGGLLCVTCTDLAVLTGNYPEVCYAKYRGMPTKARYMHEMAVRIVLNSIESHANRYGRHIVPIVCVAIDFYLRCFVRVYTSKNEVKSSCLKLSTVYQSTGCSTFYLQPVAKTNNNTNFSGAFGPSCPEVCPQTGQKFKLGGPIWSDPMHDVKWVEELITRLELPKFSSDLHAKPRILGLLTAVSEELQDIPLFYDLTELCSIMHCSSPRMDEMKAALINGGYRVSNQHKEPSAVKTDAPPEVVWDIMKCWVAKHPISTKWSSNETLASYKILSKPPIFQANFTIPPELRAPKKKVSRFPPNPEANWGPKARAVGKRKRDTEEISKKSEEKIIEKVRISC